MMRTAIVPGLGLALAAVPLACATDDPAPASDTFIAFSSSFEGFRSWPSFDSEGPMPGTEPDIILGPRIEFINQLPPSGSTEFPVGTIVVEAMDGNDQILAAVKRGGGYNGGLDWEWFELTENPTAIVWRGLGPPNGESYGGDVNGCNNCHSQCGADNDLRCSPHLQLSSF